VARAQQAPEDLPVDLLRAEAVLVRRDGHVPPLAPLYDAPYRVLTSRVSRYWSQNACDPGIDSFWYKTTKKHY
jgi:hypothetical protein